MSHIPDGKSATTGTHSGSSTGSPAESHEVLIIGSGPAGLFCADRLAEAGIDDVVLVDSGKAMPQRLCPVSAVCDCRPCDVLEGEGGAGSFSDGKITLSPTRGTHGATVFTATQERHLAQVEATIRRFVPALVEHPPTDALSQVLSRAPSGGGAALRVESYPLIHVGSDGIRAFGSAHAEHLRRRGLDVRLGWKATQLLVANGRAAGAMIRQARGRQRHDGEHRLHARHIVVACGLAGAGWLEQELRRLGVALGSGSADLGIRLETTAAALEPFIGAFYDFKAHHRAAGIDLRSFCVNGGGYVVAEYHRDLGIRGVNGHSFLGETSPMSNLAIVATITSQRHDDPKAYVRQIAQAVNAATGGYPIRQHLADLLPDTGPPIGVRATNPKTRRGRLQEVLPKDLTAAFGSYIRALGAIMPPVLAADTLVYAPEIKYYAHQVPIDPDSWESSDVPGLYVVGNAAGYTASLSAAAVSGLIAAEAITKRHRQYRAGHPTS